MMTIHLPESLEAPILEAVQSGRYASLDDAMSEAASLLVERLKQEPVQPRLPEADEARAAAPHRPIWELAAEIRESIPAEEWARLPTDGAEQHDHYIYGTPKRPAS